MIPQPFLAFGLIAFFSLMGVMLLVRPASFGENNTMLAKRLTRGYSPELAERLRAAFNRRSNISDPRIGRIAGIMSCAAACLAIYQRPWIEYIFPLYILLLAPLVAYAYLRVPALGVKRVASLQARRSVAAVSVWAFILLLAFLAVPVRFALLPASRTDSVLTLIAAIVAIGCAWRVARTSSFISTIDPTVEYFVDQRSRRMRACLLLGLATTALFCFAAFNISGDDLPWMIYVQITQFAIVGLGAFYARPASSAEVAAWFAEPAIER